MRNMDAPMSSLTTSQPLDSNGPSMFITVYTVVYTVVSWYSGTPEVIDFHGIFMDFPWNTPCSCLDIPYGTPWLRVWHALAIRCNPQHDWAPPGWHTIQLLESSAQSIVNGWCHQVSWLTLTAGSHFQTHPLLFVLFLSISCKLSHNSCWWSASYCQICCGQSHEKPLHRLHLRIYASKTRSPHYVSHCFTTLSCRKTMSDVHHLSQPRSRKSSKASKAQWGSSMSQLVVDGANTSNNRSGWLSGTS